MPTYRDTGVVLRTHKLGEADRIVTFLTKERGRVRAVARGVRKTSSKYGARLEPFGYVDFQCYEGRNLDTITQVESLAAFGAEFSDDYERWTAGQVMVETAEKLAGEEGEPETGQFTLLVSALRALAEDRHPHSLILDSYLLRSLAIGGWAPSFDVCAQCGSLGPHRAFNHTLGGALCAECRVTGSTVPVEGTMQLLGALLEGNWEVAEASDDRQRKDAAGLVAVFTQWHLERNLRSLRHVDRGW